MLKEIASSTIKAYHNNDGYVTFTPPPHNYITSGTDLSEEIIAKVFERFSKVPIVQHKCHNCGATVEMDVNKHIFICRYCGSAYAIGTTQINDIV